VSPSSAFEFCSRPQSSALSAPGRRGHSHNSDTKPKRLTATADAKSAPGTSDAKSALGTADAKGVIHISPGHSPWVHGPRHLQSAEGATHDLSPREIALPIMVVPGQRITT
jgi:hypothetical protein